MISSIDDAQWPIVTLRWVGLVSDELFQDFLAQMDQWLERKERFGLLIDSRGSLGLTSNQRYQLINHMKSRSVLTSKYLVQALVLDNMIMRSLLFFVRMIHPYPFPNKTFADVDEAREWLLNQLAVPAPVTTKTEGKI